jgi:hypothetical protein
MMAMTSMVAAMMPAMSPVVVPIVIAPVVLHVVAIAVLRSRGLRPKRRGAKQQNASDQK